jgi:hypothetical protein
MYPGIRTCPAKKSFFTRTRSPGWNVSRSSRFERPDALGSESGTCLLQYHRSAAVVGRGLGPGEPASGAAADFAHAAAEPPAQQRTQRHTFGIADFGGDLIDAGLAGLEQVHGALDPQILKVFERRFA